MRKIIFIFALIFATAAAYSESTVYEGYMDGCYVDVRTCTEKELQLRLMQGISPVDSPLEDRVFVFKKYQVAARSELSEYLPEKILDSTLMFGHTIIINKRFEPLELYYWDSLKKYLVIIYEAKDK